MKNNHRQLAVLTLTGFILVTISSFYFADLRRDFYTRHQPVSQPVVDKVEQSEQSSLSQVSAVTADVMSDGMGWVELESAAATGTHPNDWFAMINNQPVTTCHYTKVFSSQTVEDYQADFDQLLVSNLQQDGWSKSVSGGEAELLLGDAGGPGGTSEVFVKYDQDLKQMRFARVSLRLYRENMQSYMRGETEDMCPCHDEVSLSISGPVSVE